MPFLLNLTHLEKKSTKFSALRANYEHTSTFDQIFSPKNREEIRVFTLTGGEKIRDFGQNIYPCHGGLPDRDGSIGERERVRVIVRLRSQNFTIKKYSIITKRDHLEISYPCRFLSHPVRLLRFNSSLNSGVKVTKTCKIGQ